MDFSISNDNLFNENYKTAEFKDIELLQFSGAKDKAGQKLYEADVIKFNDGIDDIYGLISYDDEDGSYRVSYENITEHLSNLEEDFEIVGNIFENPQLHEQLGY
ncbi:YopX family protein [Fusobacterium animalis]|uniref:YopX family protein n=1 Tax=Fusobacterium animalis TaxID=76859 RepID=UPI0030D38650